MTIALVLFAIAALGGLTLAGLRFANKSLPVPLALLHGLLAAAGLVALSLAVFGGGAALGGARIALGIFVVAALGGFFLFALHLKKRTLPIPVVLLHGVLAVTAFAILAFATFR